MTEWKVSPGELGVCHATLRQCSSMLDRFASSTSEAIPHRISSVRLASFSAIFTVIFDQSMESS